VLAEQANVTLSLECGDECRGWFDFDKLQKICTNLIANSIKYTETGGNIRVTLQEEPDAGGHRQLRFAVEDTGRGISQEHLPHIFDRFYRVSEASMAEGAGIGLNLTKELVELLGGEIRAESPVHPDVNRPGTRFTVCLPMEQRAEIREQKTEDREQRSESRDQKSEVGEQRAEVSDQKSEGKDQKSDNEDSPLILIVEDDEDVRDFIIEGLASGHRVETAEDGETGLRVAKELVPDLVVTDLMMPGMDGIALCRELKSTLETSHIPVVMLTAKTALESQVEGLQTGADDYVTKPFHMTLLRLRIANLLESRRLLREKFLREYPVLTQTVPENTPDREFIEKITAVLEENYSEWEFNPEQFATKMNMSPRSLYRKLKAIVDRTPAGFISEFRMMRAAELLQNTSHTVTEIAFQTGCDESTNFARLFKTHYGVTPSQYRSGHRSS
jgi:DNA-binding response OmpR family regulator